jgi:hypothetical protein
MVLVPWSGDVSWGGVAWAVELPRAVWEFWDRVSPGRPEFRVRRESWAGGASGAGNVSRARVPCGLSVSVVIKGFLSCSTRIRARQKKRRAAKWERQRRLGETSILVKSRSSGKGRIAAGCPAPAPVLPGGRGRIADARRYGGRILACNGLYSTTPDGGQIIPPLAAPPLSALPWAEYPLRHADRPGRVHIIPAERLWAWSRVTRLWRKPGSRGSILAGQHGHRKLPRGPGLGCAEVRGPRGRLRHGPPPPSSS